MGDKIAEPARAKRDRLESDEKGDKKMRGARLHGKKT